MLLAIALSSILTLAPQDPPQATCREVYVEAWFQETAEADLEAALRSYRRCVELGQAADRELVARALWRLGMIARAREESTVAEELFDRVLAEYDGTAAAERVRAALAAPATVEGAESEAVAEARTILRELLLDPATSSEPRLRTVFRSLTVEQIIAECRDRGESLSHAFGTMSGEALVGHEEKLAELALESGDPKTAARALYALEDLDEALLMKTVKTLASRSSTELDLNICGLLLQREDDEAMATLLRVVDRSPELIEWASIGRSGRLTDLLANPHPSAGEVCARVLATLPPPPDGGKRLGFRLEQLANRSQRWSPLPSTPAGRELIAYFPNLPTEWRDKLALLTLTRDPGPEVIDLLLADRDPAVRRSGLLALLEGEDPTGHNELMERVKREPVDVQLEVLDSACQRSSPPLSMDSLLQVEPGVVREFVYVRALSFRGSNFAAGGRSIPDVLRTGLDRGDPELLRAVFAASPELSRLRRWSTPIPGITLALQQDLPVAQGQSLAERLTLAALASPEESVQLRAPGFALGLLPPDALTRCLEPALRSSSAALRRAALDVRPKGIPDETLVRLLLDPNHLIFSRALYQAEPSPAALLGAIEELSEERRQEVLTRAKQRELTEVVRAIYLGASSDRSSANAVNAFEYLKTRDAGVLIDGLTHEASVICKSAAQQLGFLALDGFAADLWSHQGAPGDFLLEEMRQNQSILRARIEEVTEALQRWNVERLTQRMNHESSDTTIQTALAIELAALGDRERLFEYTLRGGGWTDTGGRGLVMLEDRETMRRALQESYDPALLLTWALELDLTETLFQLERAGRLRTWDLLSRLMEKNRHADLARLLLADDGPYLDRALDSRTVSLIVDAAAGLDDPELLARAAARLDSPAAVKALFEQGELERVLDGLRGWRDQARYAAMTEIARRTGEAEVLWPDYVTDQEALIETWREQLGAQER